MCSQWVMDGKSSAGIKPVCAPSKHAALKRIPLSHFRYANKHHLSHNVLLTGSSLALVLPFNNHEK